MANAIAVRGSLWFDLRRRQWVAVERSRAPAIIRDASALWTARTYTSRQGVSVTACRYEPDVDFYMHTMGMLESDSFNSAISVILVIDQETGTLVAGFCDNIEVQCGWTHEEKLGVDVNAAQLVNDFLASETASELERKRQEEAKAEGLRRAFGERGRPRGGDLSDREKARRLEVLKQASRPASAA